MRPDGSFTDELHPNNTGELKFVRKPNHEELKARREDALKAWRAAIAALGCIDPDGPLSEATYSCVPVSLLRAK
jgi:hypothetical protein